MMRERRFRRIYRGEPVLAYWVFSGLYFAVLAAIVFWGFSLLLSAEAKAEWRAWDLRYMVVLTDDGYVDTAAPGTYDFADALVLEERISGDFRSVIIDAALQSNGVIYDFLYECDVTQSANAPRVLYCADGGAIHVSGIRDDVFKFLVEQPGVDSLSQFILDRQAIE